MSYKDESSICPDCPEADHNGKLCVCGCVGSAVLRRLIAEVRNDNAELGVTGYNRVYNRYMGDKKYNRTYSRHNR